MILHVTYEMNNKTIYKVFKNRYTHVLFDCARNCEEYRKSHTVTFELEEVDEYGDKCCKR